MTAPTSARLWLTTGVISAASGLLIFDWKYRVAAEMTPVVSQSLAEVGAVKSYDNVMGQYRKIPMVPDAKANLTSYVVEKGMDGIFLYLGKEEAAIRDNPVKRSTALLQKVFGAK